MISHTAAYTPNVVTEGPELDHGETEESPRPDPRASKIRATAAIATAPAIIAGQDTADTALSAAFVAGEGHAAITDRSAGSLHRQLALNATATAE
jgi:hypothetical protein